MAFKIDKKDQKRISDLAGALDAQRREIDAMIEDANSQLAEALGNINLKIASYNETLEEARGVIDDIHSQADSDFSDKSENWQEGERGETTRAWIEHLESIRDDDLTDIDEFSIEDELVSYGDDVEDHNVILSENLEYEPSY